MSVLWKFRVRVGNASEVDIEKLRQPIRDACSRLKGLGLYHVASLATCTCVHVYLATRSYILHRIMVSRLLRRRLNAQARAAFSVRTYKYTLEFQEYRKDWCQLTAKFRLGVPPCHPEGCRHRHRLGRSYRFMQVNINS